ncbi:dehydrogenase/reductase SDR family member 8 precursor [Cordyceps fumosorosea ARSEF 2679]|uniref:Short-chain dehydrogenase/reductase 3 n=1 Tax=Cordyceps fumosorosea (strain ARSEF 2679) TaxID=1081104 RepID=A0A162LNH7_CORFA|nr:dehydrogenase/reductase SDR family member 8 precursor [Cordyceps fumosorosea ARSEF 2679]OAA73284.1 dehydrogenase/reductase SDR family member 8 precursor [Cordyceps fumosorosea ARSEF 2679]
MPMHQGFLPREGLYSVPLFKLFARTALNPSLVLPLLLLARYTKRGSDLSILHPTAYGGIKKLFYWGLLRTIVRYLSDKTRNNWVKDRYDWSREIVLITGGAAGIGAQIVKLFDELAIKVVVLDVQPMAYATSSRVHHYKCDLRSPASVQEVAERVRIEVGQPTVLINNAGVARGKTILDSEPGDVRFTFDVNTLSHYWITKAFLPSMIESNHGMIVTVASAASWITTPAMTDYAASKAAAMAFHEGLSAELVTRYHAPKVRTVIVHPGHVKTPLFQGFHQGNDFLMPSLEIDTIAEGIVKQVLTGRSGNVILPETGGLASLMRALPDWLSYRSRIDGDKYMSKWNGRQVIKDVNASFEKEKASDTGESTVLVAQD